MKLSSFDRSCIGTIGAILGVISVGLSVLYGTTLADHWFMSLLFGAVTGTLTALWAFMPTVVLGLYRERRWATLATVGVVCALAGVQDLVGNYSSAAWQINGSLQTAGVQNARYDNGQSVVANNRALLETAKRNRAELIAKNPWLPTITADGLRARLESANLAIKLEAARGGCKSKCLERTRERDALEERIALAEQKSTVEKRIDAYARQVATSTKIAGTIEKSSSGAKLRNASLAGWYELTPKTTSIVEYWINASLLVLFAVLLWSAPPVCRLIYAGGFDNENASPGMGFIPGGTDKIRLVPDTALAQALRNACNKLAA